VNAGSAGWIVFMQMVDLYIVILPALHGKGVLVSIWDFMPLIGMGATILDGARIGDRCIVGANSLVKQRFVAPAGSMILGSPAKVVRSLTEAEQHALRGWAEKYIEVAKAHAARK